MQVAQLRSENTQLATELQKANAQSVSLQQSAEHDVSRLSSELQHEAKMRAETDERNKVWSSRVEELERAVQQLHDRSSALQQAATDAQKKLSDELQVKTSRQTLQTRPKTPLFKMCRRRRNCGSAPSRTASCGRTRSMSSRSRAARIARRGQRSSSMSQQWWLLEDRTHACTPCIALCSAA